MKMEIGNTNAQEVYDYLLDVAAFLNNNSPIHPDALRLSAAENETFADGVNRILANLKVELAEKQLA